MSNIIKNNHDDAKSFFDEDVFYPRMHDKEKEIKAAKKEALRITQEAEAQAIQMLRKFQEEGISKGIEEVKPLSGVLSSLIEEIKTFKEKAIKDLEPVVVDLAFQISKKVIKDEVKTNPEIVLKNARAALDNLIDKETIVLQVNPQDASLLEKHQKEIMKSFQDIKNLKIESTDAIPVGGCYIKSERGDVDATLGVQFAQVAKSFGKEEALEIDD